MLELLLTFLAVGALAVLAVVVLLALLGGLLSAGLSLAGFLLLSVGPVVLVGWAVWALLRRAGSPQRISAADRRWLEGGRDA